MLHGVPDVHAVHGVPGVPGVHNVLGLPGMHDVHAVENGPVGSLGIRHQRYVRLYVLPVCLACLTPLACMGR